MQNLFNLEGRLTPFVRNPSQTEDARPYRRDPALPHLYRRDAVPLCSPPQQTAPRSSDVGRGGSR